MKVVEIALEKFKEMVNRCKYYKEKIEELEKANKFLNEQIKEYNRKFANDKDKG